MPRESNNLEDLVSEALLFSDIIGNAIIEVRDTDGIFTLKGTVESEQDKLAVEALAWQQEGVIEIINDLHVYNENIS